MGDKFNITSVPLQWFVPGAPLAPPLVINPQLPLATPANSYAPPVQVPVSLDPATQDFVKQARELVIPIVQQAMSAQSGSPVDLATATTWVDENMQEWIATAAQQLSQGVTPEYLQATLTQQLSSTNAVAAEGQPLETSPLPQEGDAVLTPEQLYPWIQKFAEKYAAQYGVDPKQLAEVMAAMVMQESSFKNFLVHADGTGHGLIGLDDNGLLSDFEAFAQMEVGRGANARAIPPELQMEYLAKTLGALAQKYGDGTTGDLFAAARAWHAGEGGMNGENGTNYESLIKAHIARMFGTEGFPEVETPPDSPIQPGGYTGDPNVPADTSPGGGYSANTGPVDGNYNPPNAQPVAPARIIDDSVTSLLLERIIDALLEDIGAELESSAEFQAFCKAKGGSPKDPKMKKEFLARKMKMLDKGAGGKQDLLELAKSLDPAGLEALQKDLAVAALDGKNFPVRGDMIATSSEASRYFLSQWGPTASNANGAPFGFNDCGPTSLGMALMALGRVGKPSPQEAAAFIDKMRDAMLGYDSKTSQLTNFNQIAAGARAFGAKTQNLGSSLSAIDEVLAKGGIVVGAGNPWGPWGQAMNAKGEYLNHRDPGGHFVTVMGKTPNGNYLVNDPLAKDGAIEVSPAQLQAFLTMGALGIY